MRSLSHLHIPPILTDAARPWFEWGMRGPGDPATRSARNAVLSERVRVAAGTLAVLTLLWIPFDFVMFDVTVASHLAIARVVTSACLGILALSRLRFTAASRAVPSLYLTLLVFYLAALVIVWRPHEEPLAAAATAAYVYLPFAMITGLAVFPLTIMECIGVAIPWLATAAVICVVDNAFAVTFSAGILWLLVVIACVAAIAAVSQLQFLTMVLAQSSRDALTGALTRRVGNEILAAQVKGAQRRKAPLAVALIDLDHFKSVNDGHGHEAGDLVLSAAGARMRAVLRSQDSVIRWGGEEFLMVFPEADTAGARLAIARLANHGLGKRPDGSPLTASIGIAELKRDAAVDGGALVALADQRMYRAKQAGRNRIADASGAISAFLALGAPHPGQSQDAANAALRPA